MNIFRTITLALVFLQSFAFAAGAPNIVLILADDMGYADLPKFGKSEIPTPALDRLAEEGTIFTDAYVTAPICVASRMGLMTGQYQQRFGVYGNMSGLTQNRFQLRQTLLPAVLQKAGYRTGLIGKWHLSGNEKNGSLVFPGPLERGFDEFVGLSGGGSSFWKGALVLRGNEKIRAPEYLTDFWGTEACNFIEKNHQHPFFLYLAFNAVHSPLHALDADQAKFPDVKDENRRIYDAMLLAMDRNIGRVLDKLDEHELSENTLVIFLNDNGGGGSDEKYYAPHSCNYSNNAPLRGTKFDVFEGGVRVPMILRWPAKGLAGKTFADMVSAVDIFPTLVAAAGLEMPADQPADGVNLLPYLSGEKADKPHDHLCWQTRTWRSRGERRPRRTVTRKFAEHSSAIRKGTWKMVRLAERLDAAAPPPAWQLYDLTADISEQNDLSATHPEIVKELDILFNSWRTTMRPTLEREKEK